MWPICYLVCLSFSILSNALPTPTMTQTMTMNMTSTLDPDVNEISSSSGIIIICIFMSILGLLMCSMLCPTTKDVIIIR
jgi:hypothetical protein